MPLDVAALREASRARARDRPPGPDLAAVGDLILPDTPGVRARRYRPSPDTPTPLLVYLHGGMFVLGDLETHDPFCRRLAAGAHAEVLAVDYRRAPERRFPAAVEDAVAAVRWAAECTDAPRIALGGDSAGGLIAVLAARQLPDLAALALFCPNADLTPAAPLSDEWADLHAAIRLWAPGEETRRAASPLHADDLSALPPTLLITAEHDALRPEGDALAERLRDAGVAVTHRDERGAHHGFTQEAGDATDRAVADVARLLGTD